MGCPSFCDKAIKESLGDEFCASCVISQELDPLLEELTEDSQFAWYVFGLLAGAAVERFSLHELVFEMLRLEMSTKEAFTFVQRLNVIETALNKYEYDKNQESRDHKGHLKTNENNLLAFQQNRKLAKAN